MKRIASFARSALVIALGCSIPAWAVEITLQNDSFVSGGSIKVEAGFVSNEQAAAWLTVPCDGTIVAFQVGWASISTGTPDSLEDSITLYQSGTFPTPGSQIAQLLGPVMVDGYINEFRYYDQAQTQPISVPVTAGQIVVLSFQFLNDPDPTNGPSVFVDGDNTCLPSKNGIFAIPPSSWANSCVLGVTGDFVIRLIEDVPPSCSGGPNTGACCSPSGTCTDGLTQAQCTAAGGTYQGNGTACATTNCPVPTPDMDYALGQGLGLPNTNRVRGFTSQGNTAGVDFLAYAAGAWGVNVVTGDVDLGTDAEIVTGPGPGDVFGPQVRAWRKDGTSMGKINYYAYGTLKYGVNVASGSVDADSYDEIITGAGPGAAFGPHVRGWNFDGSALTAIAKISYFAYGTLKFGVNVAQGSIDADAFHELLTAPGPGLIFGPQVRGWNYDGATITAISKVNFNAFATTQYGCNVAGGSVDPDAFAEIVAAPGPGSTSSFPSQFKGFNYDGSAISALAGYDVTPFTTYYGGRVGLGDVDPDGKWDLLAGAGRDPAADSSVYAFRYDTATLTPLTSTPFLPFPAFYGVNPSAGYLNYP
ncbi:MAG: hypothetical protein U0166_13900 [Acidobacteriota bacterium]